MGALEELAEETKNRKSKPEKKNFFLGLILTIILLILGIAFLLVFITSPILWVLALLLVVVGIILIFVFYIIDLLS